MIADAKTESGPGRVSPLAVSAVALAGLGGLCLGPLAAVPAVICGHLALPGIKRSGGALTGRGLALAGIVGGYAAVILHLALYLGVVGPWIAERRLAANRETDVVRLKRLYGICELYASDFAGSFPADFGSLYPKYTRETDLFVCPATGRKPGHPGKIDAWSDYAILPGRGETHALDRVLLYTRRRCYGRRGGHVVTVNGEVIWYDRREFDRRLDAAAD